MHAPPTVRLDPTTNEWVAFSPRRSRRPHAAPGTVRATPESATRSCPFCPGHEALTPQEIFRVGDAHAWRVRVVPNLYPAFERVEERALHAGELFSERSSFGAHEVVVESPHHGDDLRRLPVDQVSDLLCALHARYRALASAAELAAIVIFKNKGPRAGTSLSHPHWQIVATPVMPPLLERKLNVAEAHFRRSAECLYSELVRAEVEASERVVEATPEYVAFVPFASSVPYQVRIQPRTPKASWAESSVEELVPLATLLPSVLRRLDAELDEPDFNVTVTCAPPRWPTPQSFSWHLDIVPRTTIDGGFELGSGMKINTVLPEQAALALGRR